MQQYVATKDRLYGYPVRAVASSVIGGGELIFIYSGSAQLISFEINCFYVL